MSIFKSLCWPFILVGHAIRRQFLTILFIGLACATMAGIFLFLLLKPQYMASASLEVARHEPHILPRVAEKNDPVEFEMLCDTQASLIKSRFAILAALRDPKLKGRACIVREEGKHNVAEWLTDQIRIDFPEKNVGIMRVSATGPEAEDAAVVVNAIVDAYMNEVVYRDRQQRRERLSDLQGIAAEKENEIRTKRELLKREFENTGGGDEQTAAVRLQSAMNLDAEMQREWQRMQGEQRILAARLQEAKRALAEAPDAEIPEIDLAGVLYGNPTYRELYNRWVLLELTMSQSDDSDHKQGAAPAEKQPSNMERTKADYEATGKILARLEAESRRQIREARRVGLAQEVHRLERQTEIAAAQLAGFEKEVEKKHSEANELGRTSVNASMARAEVENLERILRSVADERERLRVELKSPSRVRILGDPNSPAAIPENETRGFRHLFMALGSFFAFLVPAVAIVLWDISRGRVNSVTDVSQRLKVPMIGAVPLIPAMVMRRLGSTTRLSQIWKMRFKESIDVVAARLLRKAECDQARVFLVTSALGGEGKTTLATQLARSLARAQRRIVLVDFDLRRPTLDEALGVPQGPGLYEALRGQGDIMDMVQRVGNECFSLVTAGSSNRQVLADFSSGTVAAVLEQLRTHFDFVIIDSSPLLPIVDTRLVCQHVDVVVLSVFRDISQGSKVQAAHAMIEAFGVRSVEVVMIGGEEHGNAKSLSLQAALWDEQASPAEDNDWNQP